MGLQETGLSSRLCGQSLRCFGDLHVRPAFETCPDISGGGTAKAEHHRESLCNHLRSLLLWHLSFFFFFFTRREVWCFGTEKERCCFLGLFPFIFPKYFLDCITWCKICLQIAALAVYCTQDVYLVVFFCTTCFNRCALGFCCKLIYATSHLWDCLSLLS